MSKAKKAARIARGGPGPIGAWRLTLAVSSAALMTGRPLLDSAMSGQHLDLAMGRSFGAALVVWIASGQVNRIFVDLERRRDQSAGSNDSHLDDEAMTVDHGDSPHISHT